MSLAEPNVPELLEEIGLHDHSCLIYEKLEEQLAAVISAVRIGMIRSEKCIYVSDENAPTGLVDALRTNGIDAVAEIKSGRLIISTRSDAHSIRERFESDGVIQFWISAVRKATVEGFTGVRILSEMTWALEHDPRGEDLLRYETKLNELAGDFPVSFICQYDRRRFPSAIILNAIRTHPIVIYGNYVSRNPFYVPPEEFLSPNDPEPEVERLLCSIRNMEQAREALRQDANERLHTLSRRLFQVQEDEKRHLARELHDEIGQALTAAKLNLKVIAPDTPAAIAGRLNDSIQILDRLLHQVRQLSLDLRPPLLDELGLVPALRWLADQQAKRSGLRMSFTGSVEVSGIDPAIQTACFRVAQEAITNAIRHAGAETVGVQVHDEGGRLWLTVRDDGTGFDPDEAYKRASHGASLGLLGMKERALLAGGTLEVLSMPGHGTEIRAWFPLVAPENRSTKAQP
jgi:signal transduction histidine kinase